MERDKAHDAEVSRRFMRKAQQCEVCTAVVKSLAGALQPTLLESLGSLDPYGKKLEKKKRTEAEAAATQARGT